MSMKGRERRWRPTSLLLPAAIVGGLLWGGWAWREQWRYRRALAEIRGDLKAARPGHAARKLAALASWKPGSDEAAYLLGTCERARGRAQAADQAWARVPPGSPFATRAIQGRMELEIEQGRLAAAEQLIKQAMDDPRIDGSGLPLFLGLVYCQQGRLAEAEQLIETSWGRLDSAGRGHSERAIQLLRLHIRLRLEPIPDEAIRAFLDRAGRLAPDDDRIWLARANLAIRGGAFNQAQRWLDACLRRRPDDVPVWQARLNWAVGTNQIEMVRQAADHVPAVTATPAQVHRLTAWLAARRGDAEAERRALERLIEADPADVTALDRLAELAATAGQPDRAAGLHRRRDAIPRLQARYRKLDERNQPMRDAAEMGRLAEQLGQRFEARAFLTVAVEVDPQRDDLRSDLLRLKRDAEAIGRPGLTLADRLTIERDAAPAGPR
jgi:enediyne biosynthesis protein E4